ncbi:hypothetical protein HHK36_029730 [Tetracentron sinense]|uniref:AMP-activated protein kinase glycogen-binding domain-containing protein n=1 Tax=Tetracentron sinense TaxID=13715 RepID=A0A834YEG4_TETSI|nr:hypothetical protein HHK36_029730 [Tetracentron sinense]
MVLFIKASNYFLFSPNSIRNCPSFPSLDSMIHPRKRQSSSLGLSVAKQIVSLGFSGFERGLGSSILVLPRNFCYGFVWRCKGWEDEGDPALEAEILEFMQKSKKNNVFPTKKELLETGRVDLVEAIARQGGWLSLGWDLDEEHRVQEDELPGWSSIMAKEVGNGSVQDDTRIFQQRFDSSNGRDSFEVIELRSSGVFSPTTSSSYPELSSGSSTEMEGGDDAGIQGILHRLKKERNLSFGFGLSEKESRTRVGRSPGSSADMAADIVLSESRMGGPMDAMNDQIFTVKEGANETKDSREELNSGGKENDHHQIQSRLQQLESELASALRFLRSRTDEVGSQKGHESSFEDLQKLSDAWEFQENEIMKAQDKLRSTRAKLAVLKGKMALAIIEAQKIVEDKQERIDNARKALCLIRTACIVWPNSASEVLLTGSFDGWTTQRKMERSSTGIFSLCLKLYPGRYEIKFIVDGAWKVDPLRPIVHNNGYKNNLLTIS